MAWSSQTGVIYPVIPVIHKKPVEPLFNNTDTITISYGDNFAIFSSSGTDCGGIYGLPITVPAISIEETFNQLSDRWKQETLLWSSMSDMVAHDAYQEIIGMGESVVPYILKELKREPNYWFPALRYIKRRNPVRPEDAGNLDKMTKTWLDWGSENGYI